MARASPILPSFSSFTTSTGLGGACKAPSGRRISSTSSPAVGTRSTSRGMPRKLSCSAPQLMPPLAPSSPCEIRRPSVSCAPMRHVVSTWMTPLPT
eukprot:1566538-Pleurochrysis_carterae.AAC.1